MELWEPEVVDLGGWSRGADEVYHACEKLRKMGVPVRFLFLIDPVPARGVRAIGRVLPFLRLPRDYPPPVNVIGGVAQVLAGEEHSRLFRRASVADVPTRYIRGRHGDSGWRSLETDAFVVEQGQRHGLIWTP